MKTAINIKPAILSKSESHNKRTVKVGNVIPSLEGAHEHWERGKVIDHFKMAKATYEEKVGQKMQARATPIREGVVVIKPETTMNDLRLLGEKFSFQFDIECFQIHIHRDEGHVVKKEEVVLARAKGDNSLYEGQIIVNHHAHMLFNWCCKTTGKSAKLTRIDMREMQTLTADVLVMERGQPNSRATRLEVREFKIFKESLLESSSRELGLVDEEKNKANLEVQHILDQKKKLLPGLLMLRQSYDQIDKELKNSKDELKKLESKFWLLNKLLSLPWDSCSPNVQGWLRVKDGLGGIEIKSGKDGSVYFQMNDMKARLKDLPFEVQSIISKKLGRTEKKNNSMRQ